VAPVPSRYLRSRKPTELVQGASTAGASRESADGSVSNAGIQYKLTFIDSWYIHTY